MPTSIPKYAIVEHERRFLLNPANLPPLDPTAATRVEDLYITSSRLRLRKMTAATGNVVYKLCKKYPADGPGPIVNINLDEAEYGLLTALPEAWLRKTRYRVVEADTAFSVDVFEENLAGLAIAELEVEDRAATCLTSIPAPPWSLREDPYFAGGNLVLQSPEALAARLTRELAAAT